MGRGGFFGFRPLLCLAGPLGRRAFCNTFLPPWQNGVEAEGESMACVFSTPFCPKAAEPQPNGTCQEGVVYPSPESAQRHPRGLTPSTLPAVTFPGPAQAL